MKMKYQNNILQKTNKRGDIMSLIVVVVIIFVFAIIGVVFTKVFKDSIEELNKTPEFQDSSNIQHAFNTASEGTKYLDYAFIFLFFALSIGLIISSIYIKTHPAFFVVFLIGWLIAIVLAAVFANVYVEVTNQTELQETSSLFKYTTNMIQILPMLIFVVGLIVAVILYGKAKNPSQGDIAV